jgi:hypothetical protein
MEVENRLAFDQQVVAQGVIAEPERSEFHHDSERAKPVRNAARPFEDIDDDNAWQVDATRSSHALTVTSGVCLDCEQSAISRSEIA